MPHESPTVPRWCRFLRPVWLFTAFFVIYSGWFTWDQHDYQAAIREAEDAGGAGIDDSTPFDVIRSDWLAAFCGRTWTRRCPGLFLEDISTLAHYRHLLLRLQPTRLFATHGKVTNVDDLKGLSTLREINLQCCAFLQNVDGLEGCSGLQSLDLSFCTSLQDVDGLKGLTGLQSLSLSGCTSLQNVNALKGLSGLRTLYLRRCTKLSPSALRELRAALPKTTIFFPDDGAALPCNF